MSSFHNACYLRMIDFYILSCFVLANQITAFLIYYLKVSRSLFWPMRFYPVFTNKVLKIFQSVHIQLRNSGCSAKSIKILFLRDLIRGYIHYDQYVSHLISCQKVKYWHQPWWSFPIFQSQENSWAVWLIVSKHHLAMPA